MRMAEAAEPRSAPDVAQSEEELADFSAARTLRPHVARSVILLTIAFVFLTFWMIGLTSSLLGGLSTVGLQALVLPPDISSTLALVGLGGFMIFLLTWIASLFAPVKEAVAEGNVLLEDSAARVASVFEAVRAGVEPRCPPFTLEVDELGNHPSLFVSNGREWAVVVVREIGPDLLVSWTMWRNRSTMAVVARTLSEMFSGARADDPELLRAGSCSALRQLLRTATRRATA
jgi:hypothetical protein